MIILTTDALLWGLFGCAIVACCCGLRVPRIQEMWSEVFAHTAARIAAFILGAFVVVALLDSIHFCTVSQQTLSLLDIMLTPLRAHDQETYLAPAIHSIHILGTDRVGEDILYQSIKSIRTAVIIGTVTTVLMLPFALVLGVLAGFFGGWIDDAVQYLYTTISSIPAVLLVSASVLMLQVYISAHVAFFSTMTERADMRLFALCAIMGMTGWANLCRLLRVETLKLRELEFVQAARMLGVSRSRILWRHIFPHVTHIILITVVLDFSTLVLSEAILSYVGVGVDPVTPSWGNMINGARLELARDPVVWWPLCGAMVFMFTLVFAANVLADGVRNAFDPQTIRRRRRVERS